MYDVVGQQSSACADARCTVSLTFSPDCGVADGLHFRRGAQDDCTKFTVGDTDDDNGTGIGNDSDK